MILRTTVKSSGGGATRKQHQGSIFMQDFFKFFMPAVHNDLESTKYQANKGDRKRAHECLDAMEDKLDKAQKQTEEEIKKRDLES